MIPRQSTSEIPTDISVIIDLALSYNPALAMADITTARMWVNQGCDIELDIVPTLQRIMTYKKGVTSFNYFTNPVIEARDKRLIDEKQEESKLAHPSEYYIKIFRWKRDMGLSLSYEQERKLSEFEASVPA